MDFFYLIKILLDDMFLKVSVFYMLKTFNVIKKTSRALGCMYLWCSMITQWQEWEDSLAWQLGSFLKKSMLTVFNFIVDYFRDIQIHYFRKNCTFRDSINAMHLLLKMNEFVVFKLNNSFCKLYTFQNTIYDFRSYRLGEYGD